MCNENSVLAHQQGLFIGRPNAMRHHRLNVGIYVIVLSEQIVFIVGIPVKGIVGSKEFNKIYLSLDWRVEIRCFYL